MRLTLDQHLGLYSVFHRSVKNRVTHGIFVPVVLFTGQILLFYFLGHLSTAFVCLSLAWISLPWALLSFAWLMALSFVSLAITTHFDWVWVVALVLPLHLFGWWMLVKFGHERCEPAVSFGGREVDSNLYFREGYFTGLNLGPELHPLDRLAQFNIAPLSVTYDALESLGLCRTLSRQVAEHQRRILGNLKKGRSPLWPLKTVEIIGRVVNS